MLLFVTAMDGIMLNEVRENRIPCNFTYMWNLIKTIPINKTKQEQTIDIANKLMVTRKKDGEGNGKIYE